MFSRIVGLLVTVWAVFSLETALAADCNRNGVDDGVDIVAGTSKDCNSNSIPDECDLLPRHFRFSGAQQIAFPNWNPNALVLADFDSDGKLDVSTNDGTSKGTVSVLLQKNGGNWVKSAFSLNDPNCRDAVFLAQGDINCDGQPDLVTANQSCDKVSDNVSILVNNAMGAFPNAQTCMAVPLPNSVAIADLDQDGKADIAITGVSIGGGPDQISVAWGNCTGSCIGWQSIATASLPGSVIVADLDADLDGDTEMDVITANLFGDNLSVLINSGGRQFTDMKVAVHMDPISVAACDLDSDGDIDLVAANRGSNDLSVVLNHGVDPMGGLSFAPAQHIDLENSPVQVACGDFDEDGDLDLIAAQPGSLSLLMNLGNGSFAKDLEIAVNASGSVAIGDLDGDGREDLAVAGGYSVSIFSNLWPAFACGAGTCDPDCNGNGIPDRCDIATGASADCNANGMPDECDLESRTSPDCNENDIPDECDIAKGTSSDCQPNGIPDECDVVPDFSGFSNPLQLSVPRNTVPTSVDAADLNGDGRKELVVTTSFSILIYEDNGTKTFPKMKDLMVGGFPDFLSASKIVDWDGDSSLDIVNVIRNRGVALIIKDPAGQPVFQTVTAGDTGGNLPSAVAAGNLDGNDSTDLAMIASDNVVASNDSVFVILQGGTTTKYQVGSEPMAIIADDLNGDNKVDLATANLLSHDLSLLFNNGNKAFNAATRVSVGVKPPLPTSWQFLPESLVSADLDGNRLKDLAVVFERSNILYVLLNQRNGQLNEVQVTLGRMPISVVAGDVDGDGDADLLTANPQNGNATLILNRRGRSFRPALELQTGRLPQAAKLVDVDGDGDLDAITVNGISPNVAIFWNLLSPPALATAECFHRGDADNNGQLQLTDAIRILDFLFLGRTPPTCMDAADADGNNQLQLTDAIRILGYLFLGAKAPESPGPPPNACGPDNDTTSLGCETYDKCD
jgi:hypothetical protein